MAIWLSATLCHPSGVSFFDFCLRYAPLGPPTQDFLALLCVSWKTSLRCVLLSMNWSGHAQLGEGRARKPLAPGSEARLPTVWLSSRRSSLIHLLLVTNTPHRASRLALSLAQMTSVCAIFPVARHELITLMASFAGRFIRFDIPRPNFV